MKIGWKLLKLVETFWNWSKLVGIGSNLILKVYSTKIPLLHEFCPHHPHPLFCCLNPFPYFVIMLIFTFNFCKSNVSRSTYSLQWCICPDFFSHDWTFHITFFTKDASFFWPKVTFFTNYPIFFLRKPNCLFSYLM